MKERSFISLELKLEIIYTFKEGWETPSDR